MLILNGKNKLIKHFFVWDIQGKQISVIVALISR